MMPPSVTFGHQPPPPPPASTSSFSFLFYLIRYLQSINKLPFASPEPTETLKEFRSDKILLPNKKPQGRVIYFSSSLTVYATFMPAALCPSNLPNTETDDGITPLLSVVAAGSLACLEQLIQADANVNISAGNATPLHIAADFGSSDILNCLLKAGADPNIVDEVHIGEYGRALEFIFHSDWCLTFDLSNKQKQRSRLLAKACPIYASSVIVVVIAMRFLVFDQVAVVLSECIGYWI